MNNHLPFRERENKRERKREEGQRERERESENLIYLLKSFVFNENRIV